MNEETRAKLGEMAVNAAKAVNYVGPGTVEFIYDCSTESFYFMEMNTRLQVEHPITEMITGQDLVEWQIKVIRLEPKVKLNFKIAEGLPLPLKQEELTIDGHSVEARIYAENTYNNFMPDTGKLLYFKYPANESNRLRIETGVQAGDEISIHYDPMIAKVVVKGRDRYEAIKRLDLALSQIHIVGVETNVPFLQRILRVDDFTEQKIDTKFITVGIYQK